MAGRWWRAYDEAVDDPKLCLLSDRAHRAWFNLCCITSQNGGVLPKIEAIAFKLRMAVPKAQAIVRELIAAGLVDEDETGAMAPHNWHGRQFRSDTDPTAASRSQRYRDKMRGVTRDASVASHPPETEQSQKTEQKDSEAIASAPMPARSPTIDMEIDVVDEDPKARLFRVGKTILVSFGIAEKRTGALLGQWLKTRPDPGGLLAAIQFARDQNVAEPIAYISAALANGGKSNGKSKPDLSELAFELADEIRQRERAQGAGRADDHVGSG